MSQAAHLIRSARTAAGLTQAQLAERLGTTQPVIARLERPGSNPRIDTLDDVLHAAGHTLEVRAGPEPELIDESLIRSLLRLTPEQRIRRFESVYAGAREIAEAGARSRGELA